MLSTTEIEQMSVSERLRIELLWSSISRGNQNLSSPAWHEKVLAARLAKVDEGKAKFLTVDELKAHLKPDQ